MKSWTFNVLSVFPVNKYLFKLRAVSYELRAFYSFMPWFVSSQTSRL
jgi:hypothetical protein